MNDSSIHPDWDNDLNHIGSGSNRNSMDQEKDQLEPGGEQQTVAADTQAETVEQGAETSVEGEVVSGSEDETVETGEGED